ncbi:hypothetical protein [Marinobacter sp.]|uniref:hypothetical protein n=1 Tax=Marinobacter sp. TaxID=50741 RepID=UPI003A8C8A2C
MKSLDERITEQSRSIMDRAVGLMKHIDPAFVAAATMIGIAPLTGIQFAEQMEAHGALRAADPEAYNAMIQTLPQTMTEWVKATVQDTLPVAGMAEMGRLLVANLVAPVAAGFTAGLAQKFGTMHDELNQLRADSGARQHASPNGSGRTVQEVLHKAAPDAPRGATPLSDALRNGLKGLELNSSSQTQSQAPRGPRN